MKVGLKKLIIKKIFGNKVEELSLRFILLITRKGREKYIPYISAAFTDIYKKHKNIVDVKLTTAYQTDEEVRKSILKLLTEITNQPFEIVDFSKNPGKEFSPRLFDLTALQVDCNKKLNLSSDETLKIVFGWSAKSGCSHIKKIFWYLKTNNENFKIHTKREDNGLPDDIENYTVILIIRNPYERVISGFLDKYRPKGVFRKLWKNKELSFSNFIDEFNF